MNQTIDYIQNEVAKFFNVSSELLAENTRKREVVKPRQIAVFLSKEFKVGTDKEIANKYNLDRTSVFSACKAVNKDSETDVKYAAELSQLKDIIEKKLG